MRSLVLALLMAGALAPVRADSPPSTPSESSARLVAADFLQNLKAALTSEALIRQDSSRADILARLLGSGYRYSTEDLGDGASYTRFYSTGVYDSGVPETQCIADGAISNARQKPLANPQLDLYLRVSANCSGGSKEGALNATRVIEFFGPPTSLAKGAPYSPPHHGSWPPDVPATRPLGNKWIKYEFSAAHSVARVEFNTNPAAEVIEIAVSIQER